MAKQVVSCGIIIFHEKDSQRLYLILRYVLGHWEFAKGKIEAGEDKKTAAMRELKEETGLSATIIPGFESTFSYDFVTRNGESAHKVVYLFVGTTDSMNVRLSDEHIDFAWLPYEAALERLSFNNAKQALTRAHHHSG